MNVSEIDISGITGTNCYCSFDAAEVLRRKAENAGYEGIHLFGSGNYHYISLFFLEKIKTDFSLLLIDRHPDSEKGAFEDGDSLILSCGNWVRIAVKTLKNLKNVYCFGVDEKLFSDALNLDPSLSEKVILINDPSEITGGYPLYLSLDKDALSSDFAVTDWDQGEMSLDTLCGFLRETGKTNKFLGADICGNTSSPASSDVTEKNRLSDEKIISTIREAFSSS